MIEFIILTEEWVFRSILCYQLSKFDLMMNQRGQVTDLCCVYNWSLDLGVCNNETVNLIYIISLWNDQVMKGADMLFLLLYFIEIPMLEWWLYFDYDVLLYYLKVLLSHCIHFGDSWHLQWKDLHMLVFF